MLLSFKGKATADRVRKIIYDFSIGNVKWENSKEESKFKAGRLIESADGLYKLTSSGVLHLWRGIRIDGYRHLYTKVIKSSKRNDILKVTMNLNKIYESAPWGFNSKNGDIDLEVGFLYWVEFNDGSKDNGSFKIKYKTQLQKNDFKWSKADNDDDDY